MENPIEYRPSRVWSLVWAAVWLGTAAILFWIGGILGPEDRDAMDGFALLLFTLVPIKAFSWVMALVFAVIGTNTLRRGWGGPPTLVLSEDGIQLRSGQRAGWEEINAVRVEKEGVLILELTPGAQVQEKMEASGPEGLRGLLKRWGRGQKEATVALSAMELGTDPAAVHRELRERCPRALS